MSKILKLDEFDKIRGHIYKITNTKNGLLYVGQTRSHRKNKNKYRYFGYEGRFKDHLSEAINNTKKNQCKYLNNAIRSDKDYFKVELIDICELKDLDEKEIYYIHSFNSYYPNGYNLTKGGKTTEYIKINSSEIIKEPSKRGREHGYKHNDETKIKIKERLNEMKEHLKNKAIENKSLVSNNIIKYYDNIKIEKLSKLNLDYNNLESYIKPIYAKGNMCGYKIYIDRNNKFVAKSEQQSLTDMYNRLKNILLKAKDLKSKNC